MRPDPHFVYFIHWPKQAFVKVGCSRTQRWRAFRSKGGVLVCAEQFRTATDAFAYERAVHGLIKKVKTSQQVFDSAEQAKDFLGSGGGGWRECYRVSNWTFDAIRQCIDGAAETLYADDARVDTEEQP